MSLPVLDEPTRACASCHGPCCAHSVRLSPFDLVRLVRGLGVPWSSVAELEVERLPLGGGFRLDGGGAWHVPTLRRRALSEDESLCALLLVLPGGHRRCGVHALRPWACRAYPLLPAWQAGGALDEPPHLGAHVMCPDGAAAIYRAAAPSLQPLVDEDAAEQALAARVLARWDEVARRVPAGRPLPVETFVAWAAALDDALGPLRSGGAPRADWQLSAYALVDAFPLPPP